MPRAEPVLEPRSGVNADGTDDLKDLGVNAIGHRRLLSNAIEALRVAQSALALKIRGKVERSRGRTAALET